MKKGSIRDKYNINYMKKKNKKYLLIAVIIGIILVLGYLIFNSSDPFKVNLFSIVGGTPGVSEMDLTITVENTGNVALTCTPVSATPIAFDSALDKSSKVVPITGTKKASWTSNKISTSQFEGLPNPDRFEVTIRCSYNTGQEVVYLPDKTSYIDLNILSEGTNVNFRTTDLTYDSGSTIAWNNGLCGGTLTKAGYGGMTHRPTSGTCGNLYYGYLIMSNLPGGRTEIFDGTTELYVDYNNPNNMVICTSNSTHHIETVYGKGVGGTISISPDKTTPSDSREIYC